MKKLIMLLCFSIFTALAVDPHNEKALYIPESPIYRPFEALSQAVAMVESSNDPYAYNPHEKAFGKYQIRPIRLKDFNLKTGKQYQLHEMYDTLKAKEVFMFYALQRHYTETEYIARTWNGGENGMKKRSTKKYYRKVSKYLELSF
jgi:hypothetical protein